MPAKILVPPDFEEFAKNMKTYQLAEKYGVSTDTIRKWRYTVSDVTAYNRESPKQSLYSKETADICLNCTSLRCLGYCDKFRSR